MRILIAVKSHLEASKSGFNDAIMQTWGKDSPVLPHFFIGASRDLCLYGIGSREVALDCPDDYDGLPKKTKAILAWALPRCFEMIFLCDTDTFVVPSRLFASEFKKYDLYGRVGGNTDNGKYYSWPSGGAGYWISARAAEIVASAPDFGEWAEDRMVGQILGPHIKHGNLTSFHDANFSPDEPTPNDVTRHYCAHGFGREFDTEWMYKQYEEMKVRA